MYSLYWLAILIIQLSLVCGIRLITFGNLDVNTQTTPILSSVTTTAEIATLDLLNCDFDVDTCEWRNAKGRYAIDNFDWNHGFGSKGHRRKTGAKDDHGGGGGYMYINSGSNKNRTAKLYSYPIFTLQKNACLKFWYHMRGRHMGHLKVYLSDVNKNSSPLWQIYGSQGNKWLEGKIPIGTFSGSRLILFEAFDRDAGRMGNILLDDITFTYLDEEDDCPLSPKEAAPPPVSTQDAKVTTDKQLTSTQTLLDVTKVPKHKAQIETTSMMMINDEYTKSSQTSTISSSSELYYEETSKPKITVLGDDTTHKVRENSYKIYTAVGIFGLFILFAASLFCFVRYKRQRRLNYYDNCTVAMTRMAPDGAKSSNQSLEYRMLA